MSKLKTFQDLIKEENKFPINELRDYYLRPAIEFFKENPEICYEVYDDKTAIMSIVEEQIKQTNHSIRQVHLNSLTVSIATISSKNILNFQDFNGNSIIHLTTKMYCYPVSVLDIFKENETNFSLINKNGETPLIKISTSHSLDDLKFIHSYTDKKLINHSDLISGSTALMHALNSRKMANIYFLLNSGSSVTKRNYYGMNAIDIVMSKEYKSSSEKIYYEELLKLINIFNTN